MDLAVVYLQLDSMILRVFSNLDVSILLFYIAQKSLMCKPVFTFVQMPFINTFSKPIADRVLCY